MLDRDRGSLYNGLFLHKVDLRTCRNHLAVVCSASGLEMIDGGILFWGLIQKGRPLVKQIKRVSEPGHLFDLTPIVVHGL